MDFSASIDHGPAEEGLRLSVMFVAFLVSSCALWLLLRREGPVPAEGATLPPSKRLKRLFLIGGVSVFCFGFMALVYYSNPPSDMVMTVSGEPAIIAVLPVSHWGFGVSDLDVFDQRIDRSSYCLQEVPGVCLRFGFHGISKV